MPKTLLLADDSVTIQKVVGISFANEDIVLLTVDNGDDAIARARDARPDVVLADVVMPGKNGYDVCQAIKADPNLAHIPVLLLTGTFEAFDEQRAARVAADGHITKPFEAQALVDKVNALLARATDRPQPGAGPKAGTEPGLVKPSRAPAPPPPEPVSHTADTAYDFFDEEPTPFAGNEAPHARPSTGDTTLLLGADAPPARPADPGGFAFDDLADTEREPALPPRAAAQDPLAGEDVGPGLDFELATPARAAEAPASLFDDFAPPVPPPIPPQPPAAPAFEPGSAFEWDAAPAAPPAVPDAETRMSIDAPAAKPAPPEPEPDWFAPGPPADAATRILGFDEELEAAPAARTSAPPPPPAPSDFELEAAFESGAAFGDAILDPSAGRGYDVSSSDLGAPLAPPPPEPVAARTSASPAAAPALDTAASRRELHDTLEKLAWEAFGPIAESLVRDAVERIERIAWEVIPQMAESLIREEIRKLKGE